MDINNMEFNNILLHNIETDPLKHPKTLLSALLHRSFQIVPKNTFLKMANMMTLTY